MKQKRNKFQYRIVDKLRRKNSYKQDAVY